MRIEHHLHHHSFFKSTDMKQTFFPVILIALQILLVGHACAEKADSDKPIEIVSIKSEDDDLKQIKTFTGNVVLTQGTLVMKGSKLVITTTPDGWQFGTMYATTGSLATMRQKRDGGPDLWMEGEAADRITYDQKTSIAILYTNAKVRRITGVKPTDEAEGAFLSYNSQTEIVTGANNETGESKAGDGRVKVTIQPKNPPATKAQ
jgi:lipopolysaccharide export system protein LptA